MRFNYWQTFYEDEYYHVYNRAIGRDSLFTDDGNYKYFLKKWKQYIHEYVDTYAYCLMGNHFHYLIRIKPITEALRQIIIAEKTVASKRFYDGEITLDVFLEDQFKRYFSSYTLAYNKQHKRHGGLFQESFKRIQITNEVKLLNTICYIHHNPIHHDYSPFYDVWQYSSFNAYLSNKPTSLARQQGLALFGGEGLNFKSFKEYHEAYQKDKTLWKKALSDDADLMDY